MEYALNGKTLTLTIPLGDPRQSSTGKSDILASTGGYMTVGTTKTGQPIKASVNVIVPR